MSTLISKEQVVEFVTIGKESAPSYQISGEESIGSDSNTIVSSALNTVIFILASDLCFFVLLQALVPLTRNSN